MLSDAAGSRAMGEAGRAHVVAHYGWPSVARRMVGLYTSVLEGEERRPRMMDVLSHSPFDVARERRVVIIADWLPPDFGAVGSVHATACAGAGRARSRRDADRAGVGRILGAPRGEGEGSPDRGSGCGPGPVPRGSLLGRLAWTVWTDLRLVAAGFRYLRAADGILFTGSPPFMIHLLAPLRFLWRGRLVYRITDFHPECLIAAQARPSLALSLLLGLTNFWRRRVDGFEVLGLDQKRRLAATGVADQRIALVRDGSPVDFSADDAIEPLPAALADACVLLYAGNYGVAHELDTVAEGYAQHHRTGSGRVRLLAERDRHGRGGACPAPVRSGAAVPSLSAGAARTSGGPSRARPTPIS